MSDTRPLFIDGRWINTSDTVANINPSDTSDVIGHYAQATEEHVTAAINAAQKALSEWGDSPLRDPLSSAHGHR